MNFESLNIIWTSLKIASLCQILGFPIAVFWGYLLAKRQFWGKTFLSILLLSPIVLPPVVTGYILLDLFHHQGFLGKILLDFGVEVPFTFWAATLSAFVVGMPFYIMGARGAFEAVDQKFLELAYTFNLSPLTCFFKVSLPLAAPGIAAGSVLAFARALSEFGATIVFAGNITGETQTIPLAIYALLDAPDQNDQIQFLVLVSIVIALAAVASFEQFNKWQKKRLML